MPGGRPPQSQIKSTHNYVKTDGKQYQEQTTTRSGSYVVHVTWCMLRGVIYVAQHVHCRVCGACVVCAMWCKLLGETYAMPSCGELCGVSYSVEITLLR